MSHNKNSAISKQSPAAHMQKVVQKLLENAGLWEETLICDIPKSWEKYGDLVLFNGEKYFRDDRWKQVHDLWPCICNVLRAKRIALKHYIKEDAFRSPNVKLVFGNDTWVEFKDNGVIYCWNIQCNMFCAGNTPERHRISTLQCEGEIIVDMYAGIGYFTLPYLVKARAKLVHACEWNPNALKALNLNLSKNNVADRCVVHEGDSRLVCPKYIADRVNLGLLPSSESGWRAACQALNPISGGTLHIHENVTSGIKNRGVSKSFYGHVFSCETCRIIVQEQEPHDEDTSRNKFCCATGSQPSFIFQHNTATFTEDVMIKWKRVEWKIWALHVCHKLSDIFLTIYEQYWKVAICNLHYVKSYAPHIDHLVLDVKCKP